MQPFFARRPKELLDWLDAALSFANAHLMLHTNNRVAAVAAHGQGCSYLYPRPESDGQDGDGAVLRQRDGQFEAFYRVESGIRKQVTEILRRETSPGAPVNSDSLLSGALCLALSYVNRQRMGSGLSGSADAEAADAALVSADSGLSASLLVMSASGDTTSQYMNYMNAFFSAQKMGVHIDACMVHRDSSLLQQGADITGGVYRRVDAEKHFGSLLQFLLWLYLPESRLRGSLSLPSADRVDYRAACFCHRELVDVGFVCSVCLSVFCNFIPICSTCHTVTKFKPPMLGGGKKKKAKVTPTAPN